MQSHFLSRLRPALAALVGLLLVTAGSLSAQQRGTITGRVVDPQSTEGVVAAQIHIPSLKIGAITEANGRFTLANVPPGTHVVTVERIGYRRGTQRVTVEPGRTVTLNFDMPLDALALDAVVVTGTAGGTQKRALGNTVASVTAASITEKVNVSGMQDLLTARATGVSLFRGVGNVGAGSTIRIRGVSSMQLGSQPLIFVDGIRVNNNTNLGPSQVGGRQVSSLDDFDPNEIESVEIIKGPAAATLYGTEASAGVIQIITKKGQSGAPQFELQVSQGANWLMNPSAKIGDTWACAKGKTFGALNSCRKEDLVAFVDPATGNSYRNLYDYEVEVNGYHPLQTGRDQTYNLSVRGGTDAARYFLSGTWDSTEGMVDYNYQQRLNLRGNVSVLLPGSISLDFSTGFVDSYTSFGAGDAGSDIWRMLMWGQPKNLGTDLRGYLRATPEELATIESVRDASRFTGSVTTTQRLGEWFTQRLVVGLDRGNEESYTLHPRDPRGAAARFGQLNLGNIDLVRPLTKEVTFDYTTSANLRLNPSLAFKTSFGMQYYGKEYNSVTALGQVFAATSIRSIEGASQKTVGQIFEQNKSLGLYVQEEINFRERAFLTVAVRGDDNSAFGSNYDAAIYPKVSGSWVLSEEDFFNVAFINSLRLRGAWGKAGRQPETFAAVTLYGPTVGPGGTAAVTPRLLGNPDLGPEVSTELELGFEAAALDNRLSADFTWYSQKVRDALASVPLAPSQGFSGAQSANIGQLDNWGWEASLKSQLVQRDKINFELGLAANHTMNEIKDLGGNPETSSLRVGFPYPVYVSDIIREAKFNAFGTPDVASMMCDGGTGKNGLYRGGATVPCSQMRGKQLLLGPQFPSYTFTVDGTLGLFSDLQLFAVAQGEYGRWNSNNTVYGAGARAYNRTLPSVLRDDPVYIKSTLYSSTPPNDLTSYIRYEADFWKLREVGARYKLPSGWAGKVGAKSASFTATGRALWRIWQKTKLLQGTPVPDPEETNPSGGSIYGNFPPLSSFVVALRVGF